MKCTRPVGVALALALASALAAATGVAGEDPSLQPVQTTEPLPPLPPVRRSQRVVGDVEERLARPFDQIDIGESRVRDVLGRLSALTGVSVSIDARRLSRVAAAGTLRLTGRDVTALDLLLSAARTGGLDVLRRDDSVVLHVAADPWTAGSALERVAPIGVVPAPGSKLRRTRGRVTDRDGRPVAEALVAARRGAPVRCGSDGRFALDVPRSGARLTAWKGGYRESMQVPVDAAEQTVVLGPRVALVEVFAVAADDGEPVAAPRVLFVRGGDEELVGPRGDGAVVRAVTPGWVRLCVSGRGHALRECAIETRVGTITRIDAPLRARALDDRLREERSSLVVADERFTLAAHGFAQRHGLVLRFGSRLSPESSRCRLTLRRDEATLGEALHALCDAAGATMRIDAADETIWIE